MPSALTHALLLNLRDSLRGRYYRIAGTRSLGLGDVKEPAQLVSAGGALKIQTYRHGLPSKLHLQPDKPQIRAGTRDSGFHFLHSTHQALSPVTHTASCRPPLQN